MKAKKLFLITTGASLLLAAGAFAGNENKGKLTLEDSVSIEGKQLAPGGYTVAWKGDGPDVVVTIAQDHSKVATLPAHIVPGGVAHLNNGYISEKQADGSRALTSIFFEGKKFQLELAPQQTAKMGDNSASHQK